MEDPQWEKFLLKYSGDVDKVLDERLATTEKSMLAMKGTSPDKSRDDVQMVSNTVDLEKIPLAVLEAEIKRLEKLIAVDKDTANKLGAITKRIGEENQLVQTLTERLADCNGAKDRALALTSEHEEAVLNTLYAPLMAKLRGVGGSVQKLSFTVDRTADISAWAKRSEELLDLRKPPFMGQG